MSILINFKVCDNSPECGGIKVCPNKALCFDEQKDSLVINNDVCVSCNRCVKSCPVGAIFLATNQQEYKEKQREINNDPRTRKDLFVERYGAVPISSKTLLSDKFQENIVDSNKFVVLELLDDDSIECLIKSIPIKEILPEYSVYYKFFPDLLFLEQYKITTLPALLFFNHGKVIGNIEGFYGIEQKEELIKKINRIIKI